MKETKLHGGSRGCSEGSFAPFIVVMWLRGEKADIKVTLMDVGGRHWAAGLGGSRRLTVCLMSDEKKCCAVTRLNHGSLSKNTDTNEVNQRYTDTATDSITLSIDDGSVNQLSPLYSGFEMKLS